ncbi:MAG: hypothetical protein IBV53_06890 [Candidatus Atribacteria bacterium]
MPKIPRDISGRELAELLKKYGYEINRKTGSHFLLTTIHYSLTTNLTGKPANRLTKKEVLIIVIVN